MKVKVNAPNGIVESKIVDNKDGTYSVSFTPQTYGEFVINITVDGKDIDKSPYRVNVLPNYSKIKVFGDG